MSFHVRDIAGVEVRYETGRVMASDAPRVMVHRLGSTETMFFTPEEARALAEILAKAARRALQEDV